MFHSKSEAAGEVQKFGEEVGEEMERDSRWKEYEE